MSLTKQDLNDVHDVILEALDGVVNPRFDRLESRMDRQETLMSENNHHLSLVEYRRTRVEDRLEIVEGSFTALHNDVLELYGMIG